VSSVRDRIKAAQKQIRDGALTPDMVRENLAELTGLLGNVNDEVREADIAYAHVLVQMYGEEKKANRAKLRAETSDEYRRAREAKDTHTLVVELIRTCRAYLRSLDTEMQLAR